MVGVIGNVIGGGGVIGSGDSAAISISNSGITANSATSDTIGGSTVIDHQVAGTPPPPPLSQQPQQQQQLQQQQKQQQLQQIQQMRQQQQIQAGSPGVNPANSLLASLQLASNQMTLQDVQKRIEAIQARLAAIKLMLDNADPNSTDPLARTFLTQQRVGFQINFIQLVAVRANKQSPTGRIPEADLPKLLAAIQQYQQQLRVITARLEGEKSQRGMTDQLWDVMSKKLSAMIGHAAVSIAHSGGGSAANNQTTQVSQQQQQQHLQHQQQQQLQLQSQLQQQQQLLQQQHHQQQKQLQLQQHQQKLQQQHILSSSGLGTPLQQQLQLQHHLQQQQQQMLLNSGMNGAPSASSSVLSTSNSTAANAGIQAIMSPINSAGVLNNSHSTVPLRNSVSTLGLSPSPGVHSGNLRPPYNSLIGRPPPQLQRHGSTTQQLHHQQQLLFLQQQQQQLQLQHVILMPASPHQSSNVFGLFGTAAGTLPPHASTPALSTAMSDDNTGSSSLFQQQTGMFGVANGTTMAVEEVVGLTMEGQIREIMGYGGSGDMDVGSGGGDDKRFELGSGVVGASRTSGEISEVGQNVGMAAMAGKGGSGLKRKIKDLVAQIDPKETMETGVDAALLEMTDNFIDQITHFACKMARHRGSDFVDVKDFQFPMERSWNLRIPGFNSSELRAAKRTPTSQHVARISSIYRAQKESQAAIDRAKAAAAAVCAEASSASSAADSAVHQPPSVNNNASTPYHGISAKNDNNPADVITVGSTATDTAFVADVYASSTSIADVSSQTSESKRIRT